MTGRNSRIAAVVGFAVGSACALWVMWGPMLSHVARGGSAESCLKDYYVSDQYAVLSIARLAEDGLSVYQEPFSETGSSVYPSEYYRLLGRTADLTGTTVIWSWNVIGLLVSVALIAVAFVWARRLAPGTLAWVLAPVPFLMGTLYWWGTGGWLYKSGNAVLWPPVSSLYSPGAEDPAMVVAGVSLIVLVAALARRGRRSIALAAGSGAAAGLSLHLHANVAVFCVVATALVLLFDELLGASERRRVVTGAIAFVLLVSAALAPSSGVSSRIGLLIVVVGAALVSDPAWRRERGLAAAAWAAAGLLTSLPLSVRLVSETLSGTSYFYERQDSVAKADVALPVLAVLGLMLPMWVLVVVVARRLARDGSPAHPGWLPLVAGLATATLLLTLAGQFGTEGLEWHRFLIYGSVFTTMAAAPGLWIVLTRAADGRELVLGVGAAVLLAATIPTTIAFADSQRDAVACTLPQEQEAFVAIGKLTGDGLLLPDRCFRAGPLRLFSDARIAYFNAGIAAPPDREETELANITIQQGHLPDAARLRRIGVTGFVTNTQCAGVPPEEIASRFGAPRARIPLRNGEEIGLPPGLVYEYYDVPGAGTG